MNKRILAILLSLSVILVSGCSNKQEEQPDTKEQDLMRGLSDEISNFNVFLSQNFSEISNIATGKDSKFILIDDRYDNLTELEDDTFADAVDETYKKDYTVQEGYCVSYDWQESAFYVIGTCKAEDNEIYSFMLTFVKDDEMGYAAINRSEGPHEVPMAAGDVEISPESDNGTLGNDADLPDHDLTYDFPDSTTSIPSTDSNYEFGDTETPSSDNDYDFGNVSRPDSTSEYEFGDTANSTTDNNYEFSNSETSTIKEGE